MSSPSTLAVRDRAAAALLALAALTLPAREAPAAPRRPTSAPDVAALAERVKPFVVNITTIEKARPVGEGEPFDLFFGPHGRTEARRTGLASGFIVDPAGYVVTNEHVVRDTSNLRVRLADDRELEAKVVGRDPKLDIALLRLEGASDLPAATLGSSDSLKVGEVVLAVGNPFGLGHTVTLGIVSAKSRSIGAGPYDEFIQTDASINPGNSGGPLLNSRGEVIGMNSVVHATGSGIGFAIPSDAIKAVLPQLRAKGHVDRGKLGLRIQPVSTDLARALGLASPRGALIAELEPGGAAVRAGLREGDVIVEVNGTSIQHAEELARNVAKNPPGSRVVVGVMRDAKRREVTATLDRLEEPAAAVEAKSPAGPTGNGEPLGVRASNAPDGGVLVDEVLRPDEAGELEEGDVILEVNHVPVANLEGLRAALTGAAKATLLLRIRREDRVGFAAVPSPRRPGR